MANDSDGPSAKVLNVYELVEAIASYLPPADLFILRRVSKTFQTVLETSVTLRQSLQFTLPITRYQEEAAIYPHHIFKSITLSAGNPKSNFFASFVPELNEKQLWNAHGSWRDMLAVNDKTCYMVLKRHYSWGVKSDELVDSTSGITLGQMADHLGEMLRKTKKKGVGVEWAYYTTCMNAEGAVDKETFANQASPYAAILGSRRG